MHMRAYPFLVRERVVNKDGGCDQAASDDNRPSEVERVASGGFRSVPEARGGYRGRRRIGPEEGRSMEWRAREAGARQGRTRSGCCRVPCANGRRVTSCRGYASESGKGEVGLTVACRQWVAIPPRCS